MLKTLGFVFLLGKVIWASQERPLIPDVSSLLSVGSGGPGAQGGDPHILM